MRPFWLLRTILVVVGPSAVSCAARARPAPTTAVVTPVADAPLCPDGTDGFLAAHAVHRDLTPRERAEVRPIYLERDREGCLTVTEQRLTWKGDTLDFGYWRVDARRARLSFRPFISDLPLPAFRSRHVANRGRGLPCYAAVSESGDFVAWPEGGGCEPPSICVARTGDAVGTCFSEPEDRRPALQAQIDDALGGIDRFFWLERVDDEYRCTEWTVTERTRPTETRDGSAGLTMQARAVRRTGSREQRLSAGIYSDGSLPGVQLSGPQESVYEDGAFFGGGGIPLCATPIAIDRIEPGALWTDHGPWYLSRSACDAALTLIRENARGTAALVTRAAGCASG